MSSTLEINGKKLLTIKSAAELTSYSRDYITRLAREKKITATQVGRQWYVDEDSLLHYTEIASAEQKIRQQHLSHERKQEILLKEKVESKVKEREKAARLMKVKARKTAAAVLVTGLLFGLGLERLTTIPVNLDKQVASAPIVKQLMDGVSGEIVVTQVVADDYDRNFDSSIEVEVPEFSDDVVKIATLGSAENGILLLPNIATDQTAAADLFSDEVTVESDADGRQYVIRRDAVTGAITRIPFVVVPVSTTNKTP